MAINQNNLINKAAADTYKTAMKSGSYGGGYSVVPGGDGQGRYDSSQGPAMPKPNASTNNGANGISASSSNNVMTQNGNSASMSQAPQGYMGVRDALTSRGIDNAKIGWNDTTKSVTYDGKDIYKPSSIVDGKSYASERDINSITNSIYKSKGDELVAATASAAGTGLENIVQWTDGKCIVGGQDINVKYVDNDGKAWVSKKELESALDSYRKNNGITGDKGVYDDWYGKYNDKIQSALDKIINRDEWSYDPYNDPAYLAYKNQYEREGNRAYQDAYASMAGATGGYGNSAAVTAGGQQLNYYQQQLNDRVPELMQNSYNRYLGEQELNRAALEQIRAVGNDDYSKLYTANNDAINRANAAANAAYERDLYARYQAPLNQEYIKQAQQQTKMGEADVDFYRTLKQQSVDRGNVEIGQMIENLDINKYVNAFNRAYTRGYFSDSEAAVVGYAKDMERYPDTNGYPNPKAGEAMSDLAYWKNYGLIEFNDQQEAIINAELRRLSLGLQ